MKGREKFWGQQYTVSKLQIELVININAYRQKHHLSQKEMAKICTLYGGAHGIKFETGEINSYENFRNAPSKAKFQVLCNVLNMNPTEN